MGAGSMHRKAIVLAVICVTLILANCSSPLRGERYKDSRFAEYTQYTPNKPEVSTDMELFKSFTPDAQVSNIYFVIQKRYRKGESRLPEPDRPYWVHSVFTADSGTLQALADASSGSAHQLPGIYTDLRQYVPQGCTFSTVQADEADTILGTDHAQFDSAEEGFHVDELVASQDCNLVIMTGTGGKGRGPSPKPTATPTD